MRRVILTMVFQYTYTYQPFNRIGAEGTVLEVLDRVYLNETTGKSEKLLRVKFDDYDYDVIVSEVRVKEFIVTKPKGVRIKCGQSSSVILQSRL